jgi:hypothetical protein
VTKPTAIDVEQRFWRLAGPLLALPGVTRSTMMGLPCLRVDGSFFASYDRRTGDLLVKLPEARVGRLVHTGSGRPFSPAGRQFREWVAIPPERSRSWKKLLDEGHAFITTHPRNPPPTPL